MCCVFRDALLHTTVLMCGYLCYCHLPVSFDQSGPSPLTSQDVSAQCFFVFHTILCKL